MIKRKRYMVVFVRKEQESYTFLRKTRVRPSTKVVDYSKDSRHPIALAHPSIIVGLKYYYFIDIHASKKGGQLKYEGSNLKYDPKILSLITRGSAIKQLTSTLHDKMFDGNTVILMVVGVIIGILIGIIAKGFF